MVTGGVISAVVVVVVAVADSAVSWHYRWPGGLWRPLLGLSEHAEPRWCYEVRVAAVGAGICPTLSSNFCSNEGSDMRTTTYLLLEKNNLANIGLPTS